MFSIGSGSTSVRKNLMEVTSDGALYCMGIGDYDGTNPTTTNSIQAELEKCKEPQETMAWAC